MIKTNNPCEKCGHLMTRLRGQMIKTNNPCEKCGHLIPGGRPRKLDDDMVMKMRKKGFTLAGLAKHFGVTKSAIQFSIRRATK